MAAGVPQCSDAVPLNEAVRIVEADSVRLVDGLNKAMSESWRVPGYEGSQGQSSQTGGSRKRCCLL